MVTMSTVVDLSGTEGPVRCVWLSEVKPCFG